MTEEDRKILECFRKETNGMWTALQPVTLSGPRGDSIVVGTGSSLASGTKFMGLDFVAYLDGLAEKYGAPQ